MHNLPPDKQAPTNNPDSDPIIGQSGRAEKFWYIRVSQRVDSRSIAKEPALATDVRLIAPRLRNELPTLRPLSGQSRSSDQPIPYRFRAVGSGWSITGRDELLSLVDENAVTLVEVTKVTDRNANYSDAIQDGRENLDKSREREFDIAADIRSSRRAIQPI